MKKISLDAPPELLNELNRVAVEKGVDVDKVMRSALRIYLANREVHYV